MVMTFALNVNKFFYYINNYNYDVFKGQYLPEWFKAFPEDKLDFLIDKFLEYSKQNRPSFFFKVYELIDNSLRYQLLSWIDKNYTFDQYFGIKVPLEDNPMELLKREQSLFAQCRCSYCLTSEAKAEDEEPEDILTIDRYGLYYDEGNETLKVIVGDDERFWSELSPEERVDILSKMSTA